MKGFIYFFQLYDARQLLIEKQNTPDVTAGYEKQLHILRKELEDVRKRLKDSENKSEQPSPLLLQLQKEMAEVKVMVFFLLKVPKIT